MHERRFKGNADDLRSTERVAALEVPRVVWVCLAGIEVRQVLDVGTGTGLFAEAFSDQGLEVSGIDIDAEMIAAAEQHVRGGVFRRAQAEDIPFGDRCFDLVFLGQVLHESDDPGKILEEAKRVGRKRVAILEWPYREQDQGPPLNHRLKPEVIADLIEKAGLTAIDTVLLKSVVLYLADIP